MTLSLVPRPDETIEGAGRALREGRTTCVGLVERCLAAIEEWEPRVRAWVLVDREGALSQARRLDDELKAGRDLGPLHGIPIGVKDIIDVEGLPTAAGASRWSKGPAKSDADLVAKYRAAGAVLLGKTVTTPYAYIDPPPTRNPWDLGRTPGGSSSGSAAAVATGMCLGALGTQTAGSLTRPAAYCGVASYKASRSDDSLRLGIVPLAPSLDTTGCMARTVGDLFAMYCGRHTVSLPARFARIDTSGPPRLGRLRGLFDDRAEPAMRDALDRACQAWREAGAEVVDWDHPVDWAPILQASRTIMATESAIVHGDRWTADPDDYPERISGLIREGSSIRATDYARALSLASGSLFSDRPSESLGTPDLQSLGWFHRDHRSGFATWVVPATTGPAPGTETTGDAVFNAPWTFLGHPTISLPIGLSPDGLPLAAQLVGATEGGLNLFSTAAWCERVIRTRLESERG